MAEKISGRQLEIIGAAGKILTEQGMAGLTTKRLAVKMGFSEAALYRHFTSKEEIIVTMLSYLAADMDERLSLCLQNITEPELQLKEVFNNQLNFFSKNPHFLVAIFSEGLLKESKVINVAIMKIMAIKKKYMLNIVKDGQTGGIFTNKIPTEDLVHIIMGSFRLHMMQWWMAEQAYDVKQKGNKLMKNILVLIKS